MPRAAPVTNATFAMLPPDCFGYGSMSARPKASGAFAMRFVYTRPMQRIIGLIAFVALSTAAQAQDIRGLEVCTAEKAMERRTGCLQSNVEFLQQALARQAREVKARLDAADREAAARKSEIAALKAEVASLRAMLADLKKPEPAKDKK
jgi:cell division protein FtsB